MLYHHDPHQWPWGQGHRLWNFKLKFLVKVFFFFSVMKTTESDSWSDFGQRCDIDLWVMKWRSAWPIFHAPVILPYILKTIWCMNIILQDYEPVWPNMWPQNNCRSLWPIFHGPVIFYLISWRLMYMYEHHTSGLWVSMTQRWPQNKCRSLWPIFHDPVIFYLISWRLMYEHHTSGLWVSMTRCLTSK